MRKSVVWLIIAACLILIGGTIFTVSLIRSNWNFSGIGQKLKTETWRIEEDFSGIAINTDTEKIAFLPSEDGTCKVVFVEHEKEVHTAVVKNGILTIEVTDNRSWKDSIISIDIGEPTVTVYLPKAEYKTLTIRESTGNVSIPKNFRFESIDIEASTGNISSNASASGSISIETHTGDISLEGVSADRIRLKVTTGHITITSADVKGNVEVTVSTGRLTLKDVSCAGFDTTGNTGRINMENVICREKLSVKRTTGDVTLNKCDAAELEIETDTGDVEGILLSEKIFFTKTGTGKIEVPETMTGGKCKITTSTGDIRISIQ